MYPVVSETRDQVSPHPVFALELKEGQGYIDTLLDSSISYQCDENQIIDINKIKSEELEVRGVV